MGEKEAGEEDKSTTRGKKRKREGADSEVLKSIGTFIDDKFKNVLKEAVLKEDVNLNDPVIQIGVKLYITDCLKSQRC